MSQSEEELARLIAINKKLIFKGIILVIVNSTMTGLESTMMFCAATILKRHKAPSGRLDGASTGSTWVAQNTK